MQKLQNPIASTMLALLTGLTVAALMQVFWTSQQLRQRDASGAPRSEHAYTLIRESADGPRGGFTLQAARLVQELLSEAEVCFHVPAQAVIAKQHSVEVRAVSGSCTEALGLPVLGPGLGPDAYRSGATLQCLVAARLRSLIDIELGHPLDLGSSSCLVAGFLPESFNGLGKGGRDDILVPMEAAAGTLILDLRSMASVSNLAVVAVSREPIQLRLDALEARLQEAGHIGAEERVAAIPGVAVNARERHKLAVAIRLQAFIAFAFLCTVIANQVLLLEGIALTRQHEYAIRAVTGASPRMIARLFLQRSLVIGLVGALIGTGIFEFANVFLDLRSTSSIAVHDRAIAALLAAASGVLIVALSSSAVAIRAGRRVTIALLSQASSHSTGRTKVLAVTMQAATGAAAIMTAGIVMFRVQDLLPDDVGIDPKNLSFVQIDDDQFRPMSTSLRARDLQLKVANQLTALGRDTEAAVATYPPVGSGLMIASVRSPTGEDFDVSQLNVTSNYFRVAGIPLLLGRAEGIEGGGAIIDTELAKRFFGRENPVGRQLVFTAPPMPGGRTVFTIAGVVGSTVRQTTLGPPANPIWSPKPGWVGARGQVPTVYLPPDGIEFAGFLVRSTLSPAEVSLNAERFWRQHTQAPATASVLSVEEILAANAADEVAMFKRLAIAGLTLLLIAVSGVYGSVSVELPLRTRRASIEAVLGASAARIALGAIVPLWGRLIAACLLAAPMAVIATWLGLGHVVGVSEIASSFAIAALLLVGLATFAITPMTWKLARTEPAEVLRTI